MTFTYKGYGRNSLTFRRDENLTVGSPVKMVYNNKLTAADEGEEIFGICTTVRGEYCGAQVDGYVELPYTGTKPTYHYCKLVCDGNGGVKVSTSANVIPRKIIMVDEATHLCGFML